MSLAVTLLLVGLAALVTGVAGIAGPWWALILLGVVLIAGAVLTERADQREPTGEDPQ